MSMLHKFDEKLKVDDPINYGSTNIEYEESEDILLSQNEQ